MVSPRLAPRKKKSFQVVVSRFVFRTGQITGTSDLGNSWFSALLSRQMLDWYLTGHGYIQHPHQHDLLLYNLSLFYFNIKLDIVDCLRHFWYTVFQELALLPYLRFLLYWQIYYFHFNTRISGDIWDQPWYLLNTRLWNELLDHCGWPRNGCYRFSYVTRMLLPIS